MKTILSTLLLLMVSISNSQNKYFVSPSISITNIKDINDTATPNLELGMKGKQAGISVIMGRDNFDYTNGDSSSNYWIGGRIFVHHELPVSDLYATGFLGMGNYIGELKLYHEAGLQIDKPLNRRYDIFIQYSYKNFTNYITTGIIYKLN